LYLRVSLTKVVCPKNLPDQVFFGALISRLRKNLTHWRQLGGIVLNLSTTLQGEKHPPRVSEFRTKKHLYTLGAGRGFKHESKMNLIFGHDLVILFNKRKKSPSIRHCSTAFDASLVMLGVFFWRQGVD